MYPIHVHGPRLCLRELGVADSDAVFAACEPPAPGAPAPGVPPSAGQLGWPVGPTQARSLVRAAIDGAAGVPRTDYVLGVADRTDADLFGVARLFVHDDAGMLGVAVRPDRRGRGHGTEAVRLLCVLAFRSLGLASVRAPGNVVDSPAAGRVLTKTCFPASRGVDGTRELAAHNWRLPPEFDGC